MLARVTGNVVHNLKSTIKGALIFSLLAGAVYIWFHRDELIPESSEIVEDLEELKDKTVEITKGLYDNVTDFINETGVLKTLQDFNKASFSTKKEFITDISTSISKNFIAFFKTFFFNMPQTMGEAIRDMAFVPLYEGLKSLVSLVGSGNYEDSIYFPGSDASKSFFRNPKKYKMASLKENLSVSFLENAIGDTDKKTLGDANTAKKTILQIKTLELKLKNKTGISESAIREFILGKDTPDKGGKLSLTSNDINYTDFVEFSSVTDENILKEIRSHIGLYTFYWINCNKEERDKLEPYRKKASPEILKAVNDILTSEDKYKIAYKPNIKKGLEYIKSTKLLIVKIEKKNDSARINRDIDRTLDKGIFNERFRNKIGEKDEELKKQLEILDRIRKKHGLESISELKKKNKELAPHLTEEERRVANNLDEIVKKSREAIIENTIFKKGEYNEYSDPEIEAALMLDDEKDIGKMGSDTDVGIFGKKEKLFLTKITNTIISKIEKTEFLDNENNKSFTYENMLKSHYPKTLRETLSNTVSSIKNIKIIDKNDETIDKKNAFVITKIDVVDKKIGEIFAYAHNEIKETNNIDNKIIGILSNIKNNLSGYKKWLNQSR